MAAKQRDSQDVSGAGAEVSRTHDARRRAPDEDTILRVAAELFQSKGYRATTMDDLAEALDISKPTLYVHARSKGDILVRITDQFVEEADRRLTVALNQSEDPEWIGVLLRSWVEIAVSMRMHLYAYLNLRQELPPEAAERYRAWSKRTDARLKKAIARNQAQGRLRADVDPAVITYALLALSNWTARWFDEQGRLSLEEVVDGYMTTLVEGLQPSRPRRRTTGRRRAAPRAIGDRD